MDFVALKIHMMRDRLLTRGIYAAAILGFFTLIGSLSRIWLSGWHPLMYLHIALYSVVLCLAIWGRFFSYSLRAGIITSVTLVLGVGLLVGGGFASFGLLSLFCFCILTTILFNFRLGIISCVVCLGIVGAIGISVHFGILKFEPSPFLELNTPSLWITAIFALALSVGIIVVLLGALNSQVESLAYTLRGKNRTLEKEIAERDRMEKERMVLEGKLRLAKKMEAVGMLAGGVAHDLNNTLGCLVGYPELLLKDLPETSPFRNPLEKIQKTGMKAARIVNDMLALTRRGIVMTEVFDLNSIVTEYFKSLEFDRLITFHREARLDIQTNEKPLTVRGSSFHLSKVIMNLVSNAAESMPSGGRIVVSTEMRHIDNETATGMQMKQGGYAVLCVSDTGIGIPEGDLEKIFEPFYTKKTMGRSGTGLGMSVVWSAVKDHHGHIMVDSIEGKGTTFTVYLPLTDEEATAFECPDVQKDIRGHGESILVVDDVGDQREIAVELLRRMGYSVHAVESGEEAIDYLSRTSVDLLILDMVMEPGMDGLETYKKILEMHPDQKAIVASGYSETLRVKEALSLGAGKYLKKPFLYDQIGHAVRTELDKKN